MTSEIARIVDQFERGFNGAAWHGPPRRALSDEHLERAVPTMGYTNYVMPHGVLQHNRYHAGQIAMLRRGAPARR
jgi:hypothetical protein